MFRFVSFYFIKQLLQSGWCGKKRKKKEGDINTGQDDLYSIDPCRLCLPTDLLAAGSHTHWTEGDFASCLGERQQIFRDTGPWSLTPLAGGPGSQLSAALCFLTAALVSSPGQAPTPRSSGTAASWEQRGLGWKKFSTESWSWWVGGGRAAQERQR